ncbi:MULTISPECIES: bifunctional helix-turn-helix transcriptional regulator/GNAT family N-acetyltransferase [Vibrio harveyi group]|uniref:bifunctional helix-turn-helix transcriptional regulator/GNAT family N-acetyltransferase n=1 Tax=Vibrio harveyi group TaxID=717610 RepID=UPI00148E7311|nr:MULTISPECIES: bifunctional helix-turn-helix transcriptional regulator/GNAT family N-acetyltransferase [Vibrio harveyi group]ELC3159239.1 GNAT family N-acetyltransferase [Vibrio harveyi]MCR9939672.1 bifunctional helix-turn-helix transcriptional regulator/GNAT family N-acetyltransferase [Vibrio owensii]MDA0384977.1 bifunctional helix-turn-helix transcriptional regulator/GNAT family N-acetyltransferase [Vibrio owensii]NOH68451.1 GNAT family N-acetyltransferase [Vibrio rotiferianus]
MNARQLRHYSRQAVRLLGMLDKQCGDVALTPVQAHALGEIQLQPLTINQLAQQLNVDKSNASRTVTGLIKLGLVESIENPKDKRSQLVALTEQGQQALSQLDQQQNSFFEQLLTQLDDSEQEQLKLGLETYLKGLTKVCLAEEYVLRPLTKADNSQVADVIRKVSAEYGLTADKGYGVADPTLDDMYSVYDQQGAAYWVVEYQGEIVGGGGFAPLTGEPNVCELQKMYFLPQTRGHGLAKRIVALSLQLAKQFGYQQCYLETTECLREAVGLYEKLGFEHLDAPLGQTGHDACEVVMLKTL